MAKQWTKEEREAALREWDKRVAKVKSFGACLPERLNQFAAGIDLQCEITEAAEIIANFVGSVDQQDPQVSAWLSRNRSKEDAN